MAKLSKALQAASVSGAAGLNVEDVFSTYVWEGTSQSEEIVNGIDLLNEGGMVWIKARSQNLYDNSVYDTERGSQVRVVTNNDLGNSARSQGLTNFRSTGFSVGIAGDENGNGEDMVSWSFRKAPKFFDVVTYTGDGTISQLIPHNLGVAPAFVIIKRTDTNGDWGVYSQFGGSTPAGDCSLKLNSTEEELSPVAFNSASDSIRVYAGTADFKIDANINNAAYVAYLFANNNGDGEFGPNADQDIIKCGSYAGGSVQTINLGFEPQWLLIKDVTATTSDWFVIDDMRRFSVDINYLNPNVSNKESSDTSIMRPTPDGFRIFSTNNNYNGGNRTYVYIAIRRGQMAVPLSSSEVFDVQSVPESTDSGSDYPTTISGVPFASDILLQRFRTAATQNSTSTRLYQGRDVETNSQSGSSSRIQHWDSMSSVISQATYGQSGQTLMAVWKRASHFCDVVYYNGNNGSAQTVPHNLGTTPELLIVKNTNRSNRWVVLSNKILNQSSVQNAYMSLNEDFVANWAGSYDYFSAFPDENNIYIGPVTDINNSNDFYQVYLFSSVAGVSKVGNYIGNGTSLDIDCGFSNSSKFVLIKRTDGLGDWNYFDTARGISTGNDFLLRLNTTDTEENSINIINPYSSGFSVNKDGTDDRTNQLNAEYLYYAIATP